MAAQAKQEYQFGALRVPSRLQLHPAPTQRSEAHLQTRITRHHEDASYVPTAASAGLCLLKRSRSTQRNAGQAFVSDTMGSRAPDKIHYTLHTGFVQSLRQPLSFVLLEIMLLHMFHPTSYSCVFVCLNHNVEVLQTEHSVRGAAVHPTSYQVVCTHECGSASTPG